MHYTMKILLVFVALAALVSCQFVDLEVGNNVSVDTEINVGAFDSISDECSLNVIYTQAPGEPSVVLTCDENLVGAYNIRVEGGTLVVDTKNNVMIRTRAKSYVTVTSPSLDGISVSGSGSCRVTNSMVSAGDVTFKVSGSGGILAEGTVECRSFSSTISGSGRISLSGVLAETAKFRGSGSGSTRVELLTADKVSATLSGSGSIRLLCKDAGDIEVSISGSGGAHLSGNARSLNSHSSGSGRVDSKNLIIGK